jgi:hypothetical protein
MLLFLERYEKNGVAMPSIPYNGAEGKEETNTFAKHSGILHYAGLKRVAARSSLGNSFREENDWDLWDREIFENLRYLRLGDICDGKF